LTFDVYAGNRALHTNITGDPVAIQLAINALLAGARNPVSLLNEQARLLERYDQAFAEIREEGGLSLASAGVLERLLAQMAENTTRVPKAA
jgi:aspartate/methionine/tyrosine aminotransferase